MGRVTSKDSVAESYAPSPTASTVPSEIPLSPLSDAAPGSLPSSPTEQVGRSALVVARLNTAQGGAAEAEELAANITAGGVGEAISEGVFEAMQRGMGHKVCAVEILFGRGGGGGG